MAGIRLAILLLACATSFARGAAWAVWEMDARAPALGGAIVASTESPAAIFFNPAALAWRETPWLSLSLTGIQPYTEFSGHGAPDPVVGSAYGVNERMAENLYMLPQVYYSRPLASRWHLGLGFCTPYGLAVEWDRPETYSGRHIATRSEMKTYFLSTALAWEAGSHWSLGLAVDFINSTVELRQAAFAEFEDGSGIFSHELGRGSIAGNSELALSAGIGILAQLSDRIRVGVAARSGVDLEYTGDFNFTPHPDYEEALPAHSTGRTSLPLPAAILSGVAFQVSDRLLLEFDFDWIHWSVYDTLELNFDDEDIPDRIIPQHFKEGRQWALGARYSYSRRLTLRGGIVRDESPQPSASSGPVLPDADRTAVGLGASFRLGERLVLDAYDLLIFVDERRVRDSGDDYNGDYRSFAHAFGIGLNYDL